jgi:hypothetical protein
LLGSGAARASECGHDGERACCIGESPTLDGSPFRPCLSGNDAVIPCTGDCRCCTSKTSKCDPKTVVIASSRCVASKLPPPPHACEHEGQRACTIAERQPRGLPACFSGLEEACNDHSQCSGVHALGQHGNACCGGHCAALQEDWAGVWYCPAGCVGKFGGKKGTCH